MNEMRGLRQEMQKDYQPGMRLFVTETGISHDIGTSYGPNYPTSNVLFAQGAVVAHTHIILLGHRTVDSQQPRMERERRLQPDL
jgi:hypothetical protein